MNIGTLYGEKVFDDISEFGDNTDRTNDIMAVPSIGKTSIVRYKVPLGKKSKVQGVAVGCDFGATFEPGAYTTAQDGAQVQLRFNSVVKFEHKVNWTGLQGYIGGADDYNAENEILLSCHNQSIDAGTVIDLYVTGKTNVRRVYYIELYGTLSNGTKIRQGLKSFIDGTASQAIPIYTVPAGVTLTLNQVVVGIRHIDLYSGKGYLVYNGLPVMAFGVLQGNTAGMTQFYLPFYDLELRESASIGVRMDAYECGNETVSATVFSNEELAGVRPPVIGSRHIIRS